VAIDRQELPGAGHAAQLHAAAILKARARANHQVTHGAGDEDFTGVGLAQHPRGERARVIGGVWAERDAAPAKSKPELTLAEYAEQFMAHRDLKPRTRLQYRSILDRAILPHLGALPIGAITADDVKAWYYKKLDAATPTWRSQCYGLLRTICGEAVRDGKASAQPCNIRGAGSVKRAANIRPATMDELAKIIDAMPEQYRAMVILAAWCAIRFGELTELRRSDVDIDGGVIRLRRAVVHVEGEFITGDPKTAAGNRDVTIPPHVMAAVSDHMIDHVGQAADALLFPSVNGGHLNQSTFTRWFYPARAGAGRPDLRFHDLRHHTGAVMAAQAGATLADLMGRLGHTTPQAAMRYQHTSAERDRTLAARLSELAASGGFA
jgi:integrase